MPSQEPTPLRRPVTEADIERALLANIEALLAGDIEQAAEGSKFFARHRLMAATGLAKLLIQDRLPAAGAGFHMIEALTFGYPQEIFRQIALNPHAPDITRFGAHRRLGWTAAETPEDEARMRLEFLATMDDPHGMLAETAVIMLAEWPGGLEILDEIVRFLAVMPADERLPIVQRVVAESESRAVWLLHAMLALDDPELQRFALRELARQRVAASSGPVARLVRLTGNDEVRREAEATAQRLRLRAVDRSTPEMLWQLPPNQIVRTSPVGLDGTQKLTITWDVEQAPKLIVELLVDDAGVVDAAGRIFIMPMLDEDEDDLLDEDDANYVLDDEDLDEEDDEFDVVVVPEYVDAGLVRPFKGGFRFSSQLPIDGAVARGVIAGALERQAATGKPLPPTFELWEPFLHEELPPAPDEPLVPATLDDDGADPRGLDSFACTLLFDHPAYSDWILDSEPTLRAMEGVPPPASSRWSLKQFRPLVERLLTTEDIERIRRNLLRQAVLLDLGDEARERDLTLRAAASLRDARLEDLPKHTLIREILQRSAGAALNPYGYAMRRHMLGMSDEFGPF